MRFLAFIAVALAATACSSSASPVGAGGTCQLATDCAEGLVCIPQKSGPSICSGDLSGVQKTPPLPDRDAGDEDAATGAGAEDATTAAPDATSGTGDAAKGD